MSLLKLTFSTKKAKKGGNQLPEITDATMASLVLAQTREPDNRSLAIRGNEGVPEKKDMPVKPGGLELT